MNPLLKKIRTHTREEWLSIPRNYFIRIRNWTQEKGELALGAGIILGIIFVLFFKILVGLVVVSGLGFYLVWYLAIPEKDLDFLEVDEKDKTPSKNSPVE